MSELNKYIPFVLIPIIIWGVRNYLIKQADWNWLKKRTLAIGITAWTVTELARSFYRPYIYSNQIFDYYIADTIGNSAGTMTAIFMLLTMLNLSKNKDWLIIVVVTIGLCLYELSNPLHGAVIDIHDLIATIVFSALSAGIYWLLKNKNPNQIED